MRSVSLLVLIAVLSQRPARLARVRANKKRQYPQSMVVLVRTLTYEEGGYG
jgi:hypothetical protein